MRELICGLDRINFKHIYALACLKLWKAMSVSENVHVVVSVVVE